MPRRKNAKKPRSKPKRKFEMRVSGGLVKQLGLQMYAGAVRAIAELISNAWDAMARTVRIEVPLDRAISPQDQIVVTDDGHGMTYKECNDAYLLIGRDRRAAEGDFSRRYGGLRPRRLQSRKGIGKLAGFGIANRVEVKTVAGGEITHFVMDYDDIVRSGKFVDEGGYSPEPQEGDGRKTRKSPGTSIILSELKITRTISTEQFRRSMARRFTVLSDEFKVFINGSPLLREEFPFEFRFPEKKATWETADIAGAGQVRWWVGFTSRPIPDEEARGIAVYVRGKMAQTPWFFGLSGSAWGQHGMQYMTGEVIADFLDQTDGPDLISTDRGTVRWEDPVASPLKDWGLKKVRGLLDQWAEKREAKRVRSPTVVRYLSLADRLPQRERRIFKSFVSRICSIPQIDQDKDGQEIVDSLVEFGFNALTNKHFFDIVRQLSAATPDDWTKVKNALAEWDIIEAVLVGQQVRGRLEVISKFEEMIKAGVPEKPEMQNILREHPWLIDPGCGSVDHEKELDTLIEQHFLKGARKSERQRNRVDFFWLADRSVIAVVEVKRPSLVVGKAEFQQLADYVDFFRQAERRRSTDPMVSLRNVVGYLIATEFSQDAAPEAARLRNDGIHFRSWDHLTRIARDTHKHFYEVAKRRAPEGDPRIPALELAELAGERAVRPKSKLGGVKRGRGDET